MKLLYTFVICGAFAAIGVSKNAHALGWAQGSATYVIPIARATYVVQHRANTCSVQYYNILSHEENRSRILLNISLASPYVVARYTNSGSRVEYKPNREGCNN